MIKDDMSPKTTHGYRESVSDKSDDRVSTLGKWYYKA